MLIRQALLQLKPSFKNILMAFSFQVYSTLSHMLLVTTVVIV
jgi:hypothetical protein